MDIKSEFTQFCGPSVLFLDVMREGRTITINYSIPALEFRGQIIGHLRNGLETVLRRVVRQMADSARNDAYRRTGHRDADMAHLLSGRTI